MDKITKLPDASYGSTAPDRSPEPYFSLKWYGFESEHTYETSNAKIDYEFNAGFTQIIAYMDPPVDRVVLNVPNGTKDGNYPFVTRDEHDGGKVGIIPGIIIGGQAVKSVRGEVHLNNTNGRCIVSFSAEADGFILRKGHFDFPYPRKLR
ncbi:hypothetical protein F7234_11185 [Pseudomonas putida]|uniref:hypothetical protein n=1 Tax=Pseudomonas putida TaxID=303 RepID=UPI00125FDD1E|nr:hypothetical protein [Pseudomonas putida]KAB5624403.1 hypothetical protein F7234_11185 [Pseudomonas putida]